MDENIMAPCWYKAGLLRLARSSVEYAVFTLALMNDRSTTLSHGISANLKASTGFFGISPTDPGPCKLGTLVGGWMQPVTGNSVERGWLEWE
jgi:hypothetical protein